MAFRPSSSTAWHLPTGSCIPTHTDAMADVEATIFWPGFIRKRARSAIGITSLKMVEKSEAVRHAREVSSRLDTDFPYNKPNHRLVSAIRGRSCQQPQRHRLQPGP